VSRTGPHPERWPLVALDHPELGRMFRREPPDVKFLLIHKVWVSSASHPLGGFLGSVMLTRRVNLRKDTVPRWLLGRPLYEFTKGER
jgi:hypothetical protein